MIDRTLALTLVSVCLAVAVGSAGPGPARAQDADPVRVDMRLHETSSGVGTVKAPDGRLAVNFVARGVATAGLASVRLDAGDFEVTIPLRRGRFAGRIHQGFLDVTVSVSARRGRVAARLVGTSTNGDGSAFGARAFAACAGSSHWDGTVYGIEEATVSFDGVPHSVPLGIAGTSDRTRRGTSRYDRAADDEYGVSLNAFGRTGAAGTARADVQLVPRRSSVRWDGRVRGQALLVGASDARLKLALDRGAATTIGVFDSEALDLSATIRRGEGIVSRDIGGVIVTQLRFDAAVPALPGPHEVTIRASARGLRATADSLAFEAPSNDPTVLLDVDEHALEVRGDGVVRAWGENALGLVGDGTFRENPLSAVPLDGPAAVRSVGAGQVFSVAVDGGGQTWLWGTYDADAPFGSFPALFPGLPSLAGVAAGSEHVLGLEAGGNVWSFGRNGHGQLGDGTRRDRNHEPQIVDGLPQIVAIAAGLQTSVALDVDGVVWAWGEQNLDGIGNGRRPVRVRGLPPIVAAGTRARDTVSVALAADGTVWTWGGANGTPSMIEGPDAPKGDRFESIVAISCGGDHDLALGADGRVWAWGGNLAGQLGDGTRVDVATPQRIAGLSGIVRIAAGNQVSFVVDADGATWMFGALSAFLGDFGTRTLPVLAPRESVSGHFPIPEIYAGDR
jgi:hypothetical protein